VVPPLAVSAAEDPAQTVAEFTVTTGIGLTVTVEEAVPLQPAVVPVTVYVVVEEGLADTEVPVVAPNPVDGAHE
jgi:hypothetical protein